MDFDPIEVRIPASTSNIGPGFDMLGLALTLYNTVRIEAKEGDKKGEKNKIKVAGRWKREIPLDESNLIYKTLIDFLKSFGKKELQFRLSIQNEVPVMAGLGSSSTAILAGLLIGNALCKEPLTRVELLQKAVQIEGHPDNVSPALFGGFTLSYTNRQGEYRVKKLVFPKDLNILVLVPQFCVSTKKARESLPKSYPLNIITRNATRLLRLIKVLEEKEYSLLREVLNDEIHQPYRFDLVPGMQSAYESAYDNGALGVFLSGSGPSLIALVKEQKNQDEILRGMQKNFLNHDIESESYVLSVEEEGTLYKSNRALYYSKKRRKKDYFCENRYL